MNSLENGRPLFVRGQFEKVLVDDHPVDFAHQRVVIVNLSLAHDQDGLLVPDVGAVVVDADRHLRIVLQMVHLVAVLLDTAHHDVVIFDHVEHRRDNGEAAFVDMGHFAVSVFTKQEIELIHVHGIIGCNIQLLELDRIELHFGFFSHVIYSW